MDAPQAAMLDDGRRLHLQHGPIDLVLGADGDPEEVAAAFRQAARRFRTVLPELVEELGLLRRRLDPGAPPPGLRGPTARRMLAATAPHSRGFVTPMAAVAGAVADETLAALVRGRALRRAYVNNGGDIALHLQPGQRFAAGLVARVDDPAPAGRIEVTHALPVRGVATSGWRGRSFSLGIADAVTVLADCAAAADAAATLIANAVNVDNPAVRRQPADSLDPDSDLGSRPVTVAVGPLDAEARRTALESGRCRAAAMRRSGLIHGAVLILDGEHCLVGGDGDSAMRSICDGVSMLWNRRSPDSGRAEQLRIEN